MYVDTAPYLRGGKKLLRHLLRHSYRENGRVKKKTIASLCNCSSEEIEAIKLALKHKTNLSSLGSAPEIAVSKGKSYGAIIATLKIAQELGITEALGDTVEGKLALCQVLGRVIFQGSRLSLTRRFENHALQEILGLPKEISVDMLYKNLSWLEEKQKEIEIRLNKKNNRSKNNGVYMYDVTSSYFEGECNELGDYGYSRDKKKGKKQIVAGLLTDAMGIPIAIRVFRGNTSDAKTVETQIAILGDNLEASRIVFVGDRAMLGKPQVEQLPESFAYITAIKKCQIEKLARENFLKISDFDGTLKELEKEGLRYITKCNPIRKAEIQAIRQEKLNSVFAKISEQNKYIQEHKKADPRCALERVKSYATKLVIGNLIKLKLAKKLIKYEINESTLAETSKLDGCYCLITDLTKEESSKETVHNRYKDLKLVEWAFRTMKQSHLEIRPIFLRREDRTRSHVFVTMLAYMITRKLDEYWAQEEMSVKECLNELSSLSFGKISINNEKKIYTIIHPEGACKRLLELAKVKISDKFSRVYKTEMVI